jgi:diguanylate cyclase (GGDEF)-like protein
MSTPKALNTLKCHYFIVTIFVIFMTRKSAPAMSAEDLLVEAREREIAAEASLVEALARNRELERKYHEMEKVATSDGLTGLKTRRYLDESLFELDGKVERHYHDQDRRIVGYSLAIMDLDDFKGKNDSYGHPKGDTVLRVIGKSILGNIRKSDIAARYGGDEFVIAFPDTNPEDARSVVNDIRLALNKIDWGLIDPDFDCFEGLTLSVGIAYTDSTNPVAYDEVLRRADQALYDVKNDGRNGVRIYDE